LIINNFILAPLGFWLWDPLCAPGKKLDLYGHRMLGELPALPSRWCSQKQQFLPRTADKEKEKGHVIPAYSI
jgi:hypothetical protein